MLEESHGEELPALTPQSSSTSHDFLPVRARQDLVLKKRDMNGICLLSPAKFGRGKTAMRNKSNEDIAKSTSPFR